MKTKLLLITAVLCILFISCGRRKEKEKEKPIVKTIAVEDVTSNSATLVGELVSDGGLYLNVVGFIWSTKENAVLEDDPKPGYWGFRGYGVFEYKLNGLKQNTEYFIKTYASNDLGLSYGNQLSFITNASLNRPLITETTESTARCITEITDNTENADITARGVCWSKQPNPTIEDKHTSDGSGAGTYTSIIDNLESNTLYYIRAYATNRDGTGYSKQAIVRTLPEDYPDGYINGHAYVDLGLPSGLKWATHNVGASLIYETGDYYAWGEIETKTEYTEENSKTHNIELDDFSGDPQYDVTTAKWGSTWRMPTYEDFKELLAYTEIEQDMIGMNSGLKMTGPNGNYIFFPYTPSQGQVPEFISVWSSSPHNIHYANDNTKASALHSYREWTYGIHYLPRHKALSVRAVSE